MNLLMSVKSWKSNIVKSFFWIFFILDWRFLVILPKCVLIVWVFGLLVIVGNSRRFRAIGCFLFFFLVLSLLFSCLVIALLLHKQKLFSNEIDDSTIFLAQGLLFYYTFTQQATYRTKKYPSKICNARDERCTIFHEKYQYIMKKIKKPIFHNDPSMGNESGFI